MSAQATQAEIELIVKLMREGRADGWQYSAVLSDVPAETGHYGLDDGLYGCGGGVSHNMRASIERLASGRQMTRPIYSWLPDTDGGAALWLDGKTRCSRCESKPVFDLDDIDDHGVDVHGDEPECECR